MLDDITHEDAVCPGGVCADGILRVGKGAYPSVSPKVWGNVLQDTLDDVVYNVVLIRSVQSKDRGEGCLPSIKSPGREGCLPFMK